jgi:hypothetical protein
MMMRNNERLDARLADTSGYSSRFIEQTDFPGDALDGRAGLDEFLLQARQRPLLEWLERRQHPQEIAAIIGESVKMETDGAGMSA